MNDEQIKEFWKGCGFTHIPFKHLSTRKDKSVLHPQGITVTTVQQECWIYPDGSKHAVVPPIDLNNLFKHAVPKVGICSLEHIVCPTVGDKPEYAEEYHEPLPKHYVVKDVERWHWYVARILWKDGRIEVKDANPALALSWACYPILVRR